VTTPPPGVDAQASLAAQQQRSNPQQQQSAPSAPAADSGGKYERPRALSQPLPSFSEVQRSGTVRLSLTVGADGRVEEVEVLESVPGLTAKVISAVQRWKFKPATRNGEPVRGQFPVDITFKEHS
jgi:periplasmic protein TonB